MHPQELTSYCNDSHVLVYVVQIALDQVSIRKGQCNGQIAARLRKVSGFMLIIMWF